ncbi:membrane protein insertion efficiency factor YidD [Candidatus Uhrbacteria bacterium]|nr:membrane protein insertion efficiency factor YidD [Candidatus Uhrbacteria bacterium]
MRFSPFLLLRGIVMCILYTYQKTVSFDHGLLRFLYPNGFCRFYPSCSEYGRIAVWRHGIMCGGWLTLRRVSRCHPWSPGGMDPVP